MLIFSVVIYCVLAHRWKAPGTDCGTLHKASMTGDLVQVRSLIAAGADVNAYFDGAPPLHFAAMNGHLEIVSELIENGAQINAASIDGEGITALHIAAFLGNAGLVSLLLKNGADVDLLTSHAESAVCSAARGGHKDVFRLLREHGASVSGLDSDGDNMLVQAVFENCVPAVKILLEDGFDPNCLAGNGKSRPLEIATVTHALNGDSSLVKLLLKSGADPNLAGIHGQPISDTIHNVAKFTGNRDLLQILIDHETRQSIK